MTTLTRRAMLHRAALLIAASALTRRNDAVRAQSPAMIDGVKALIFDVFGTLVDWRNGVAHEAQRLLEPLGYAIDWLGFADAWRALYQPTMEEVRAGRETWVKLDILHRRMLDRLKPEFGLEDLDDPVADELNLAWHRLDAWPDVVPGLQRLSENYLLAPCSNGNISIMVDLARRNGIPWDAILGAEIARDYKPKPVVYVMAAEALNLAPEEVMMVAAHSGDLRAAAASGLRTGHVGRLGESGPGTGEAEPRVPVDVVATDFEDLADRLGV